MFGTILNRTIFFELVKVFLLSLGSLTGLFLIAGLVQQALHRRAAVQGSELRHGHFSTHFFRPSRR